MNVSHHINEDLLYLYAAGELDFAWNLAIATHLAFCPDCRARNRLFEDALANSLENVESEAVLIDVESIIALAEDTSEQLSPAKSSNQSAKNAVFPQPLREVAGDFDDIEWSTMGGGIKQHIIHEENGVIARLLYIPAGVAASTHGHKGLELTQVVMGGFYDGDQSFNCGDMQIVAHDTMHQPIAMEDGPCICLAVTDAPLKFKNLLPSLFQGMFKI